MKCPNDQTDMEQGVLQDQGMLWTKPGVRTAIAQMSFGGFLKVFAYRCSKCGKIELTSEVKEENK